MRKTGVQFEDEGKDEPVDDQVKFTTNSMGRDITDKGVRGTLDYKFIRKIFPGAAGIAFYNMAAGYIGDDVIDGAIARGWVARDSTTGTGSFDDVNALLQEIKLAQHDLYQDMKAWKVVIDEIPKEHEEAQKGWKGELAKEITQRIETLATQKRRLSMLKSERPSVIVMARPNKHTPGF